MARSLLAHMYSHIKGSQEDIATYSLEYIVSRSNHLNRAFTKILEDSLHTELGDSIHYSCQAIGKKKERPDISGVNSNNKEVVLCEAKFYAGLTENQPNAYLDRLKAEHGVGLVFISPVVRKKNLWSQLEKLCEHRSVKVVDDYCLAIDDVRMSIITWDEILDKLRQTASSLDVSALSDIGQLEGFCRMMDDNAFIPFSDEDMGPELARREERHYQIPDAVVEHLRADKSLRASTNRLRATPYRHGYVRYIHVLDHALAISYDRQNWMDPNTEETPFWVTVFTKDFEQPPEYKQAFRKYPASYQRLTPTGALVLPLMVPKGASLDEVANSFVKQILRYIQDVDNMIAAI